MNRILSALSFRLAAVALLALAAGCHSTSDHDLDLDDEETEELLDEPTPDTLGVEADDLDDEIDTRETAGPGDALICPRCLNKPMAPSKGTVPPKITVEAKGSP